MKRILLIVVVWGGVVACLITGFRLWAQDVSVRRGQIVFVLLVGCTVTVACWFLCQKLKAVGAGLLGLGLGAALPIVAGRAWAAMSGSFPSLPWSPLDSWFFGLLLSIPSGIGAMVVGLLIAKRAARPS